MTIGDTVVIHDRQGWTWDGVLEEIDLSSAEDPKAQVRILGDKRPQPFPAIIEGKLTLPNLSGHAHVRSWSRGDVVKIREEIFKVTKVTLSKSGSEVHYEFTPADEKQYQTRPGRTKMSSEQDALAAVGSALEIRGEWLHVKKVTRSSFHGALGRDFTYWAVGNYVSEDKAKKLNELHPQLLARTLATYPGTRVLERMPENAVVLIPKKAGSLAASGERLALVDGRILHERVGDPDQIDSWYHYVVEITSAEMVKRCKNFIKKA